MHYNILSIVISVCVAQDQLATCYVSKKIILMC